MLRQNCIKIPYILMGSTYKPYHFKRQTSFFKSHRRNLMYILYITALLALCVDADDRFRPHKPRPGPPFFNHLLYPENERKPDLHIVDLTTVAPEMDALHSSTDPSIDSVHTDITPVNAILAINTDFVYPGEVNCPYCTTIIHDENHRVTSTESGQEYSGEQRTAEEELNEMIEDLGNLLSNESAIVTIADVSGAFDQMDGLLATDDESLEFPSTVLTALDALGARADLNGSESVATARRNVAVVMADSAPDRPVRGLRIAADEDGFTDDGLQILLDNVDPSTLTSVDIDAVVKLPASLADMSRRISFVVFRTDRAFPRQESGQYVVNSKVISVNVQNFTKMEEGEVIDIHLKPSTYEPARNMTRACAYWHFTENNTGYWSQEGCIFIKSPTGLLDTCRCIHLTHFAEILVPKLVFSEENETALEIVSLIGCFLSLFGLIIIGLTAIMFRSWRNDFNNKIWIQLTIALLINVVSFLVIVFSKFDDYNIVCMLVGILLHYAVLASFCWMLVAAVISYRKLVLVFARNPTRRLLKASAFSWLVPLVIVATLLAVAPHSYTRRFEDNTPMGGFCYPTDLGLWLSVFLPIGIVVVSNWIIFSLILCSVFRTNKIQKHGDSSEMLRRASVCCLLVFLFGLPWILGLFAKNIVAAYLFTLTTSYQGFVLFIFFVIINTKTRAMWLNKLRIKKKTKAHVSSSLITSRNAHLSNDAETPFIEPSSSRTNVTSLESKLSDDNAAYITSSGSAIIEHSHYNSKDSDIDSFITARSHGNLSEDEIFKSTDGITDTFDDEEQADTAPSIGTGVRDSANFKTMPATYLGTGAGTNENKPKTVDDNTSDIPEVNPNNREFTGNEGSFSNYSRREVENNDNDPKITIYNVPTQSASLVR